MIKGQHGGIAGSMSASQLQGPRFNPELSYIKLVLHMYESGTVGQWLRR